MASPLVQNDTKSGVAETLVPRSVDELSEQSFQQFAARIRYSFIRAIGHGSGALLLAMLCTVIFALSIRTWVPLLLQFDKEQADSIDFLFRAEMEPPIGSPVRAIVVAISDATNGASTVEHPLPPEGASLDVRLECTDRADICPEWNAGKEAAQAFYSLVGTIVHRCGAIYRERGRDNVDQFLGLVGVLDAQRKAAPAANGAVEKCYRNVVDDLGAYRDAGLLRSDYLRAALLVAATHLGLTDWTNVARASVRTCPPPATPPNPQAKSESLPPPLCDADALGRMQTLVPQQLAPAGGDAMSRRVLAGILAAHVLDYVISRLEQMPGYRADQTRPQLVQGYFISVDGILRIWTPSGFDQLKTLPRDRIWSSGSYFQDLLDSGADKSYSKVYLDTGRNGLVSTFCYPLTIDGAPAEHSAAPGRPEFDGAVCLDFGLPAVKSELGILQRVCKLTYVNVGFVRIGETPTGQVKSLTPLTEDHCAQKPFYPQDPSQMQTLLASETVSNLAREPKELMVGRNTVFLVPVRRESETDTIFLTFGPYSPPLPRAFYWSLGICLLSFIGLVIVGFRLGGSRRSVELAQHLDRMRSLPVAVIEVNGDNVIVAGNDRAEELIGHYLGKFGVDVDPPEMDLVERQFDKVFVEFAEGVFDEEKFDERERAVARAGFPGRRPSDITPPFVSIRRVTQEALRERRTRGTRSLYFAKLPNGGRWLKVIATPELALSEAHRPLLWPSTFGVLLECTATELERLQVVEPNPSSGGSSATPTSGGQPT
jgi:PAS domain-containing protein